MNLRTLTLIAAVLIGSGSVSAAHADPVTDFFDQAIGAEATRAERPVRWSRHERRIFGRLRGRFVQVEQAEPTVRSGTVSELIADTVSAQLGHQWVATALRIAHIESAGRCGAVNRSGATGVFQVMNPERFGVSRASARTCAGGVAAGVAHMRACLAKGAATSAQMMVCHNSGSPFSRRVEPAYRRYL
jgi:hypothetical protein